MKKICLALFALSTLQSYAQGTINIFNYTAYNLHNSLVGSDPTNSCYPNVNGSNHPVPVPPGGAVTYTGYYNSQLQSPPITTWQIQLNATSGLIPQPATAGILLTLATTTKWQLNKFSLDDPSGAPLYYSGASIGDLNCSGVPITSLAPTPAIPYAFNGAFWFESGGQTYFVVQ